MQGEEGNRVQTMQNVRRLIPVFCSCASVYTISGPGWLLGEEKKIPIGLFFVSKAQLKLLTEGAKVSGLANLTEF